VLERTDAALVDRMRQHAPGHVLEFVPLFHEIITAMIPDRFDMAAMADANFLQMRRVDDQLAAISQNRLKFVHAFAGSPKLVIHWRRTGENRVKSFVFVTDMDLARKLAGLVPCGLGCAREKTGKVFVRVNHHAKAKLVQVNHGTSAVYHAPNWRAL